MSRRRATFARPVLVGDVLWFGGGMLAATALGLAIAAVVLRVLGQDWFFAWLVPLTTALWALALWIAARRRRWSSADLGFVPSSRSFWHLLWEAPLAWVLAMTAGVGLTTALELNPGGVSNTDVLTAPGLGALPLTATALAVVVGAPLLEEIVFRRVVFGWLERPFGWIVGAVASAAVFAVVHVLPPLMVVVGCIGLANAVLVRAHRSLWPGIVLHAANNGFVTLAVLSGTS